MKESDFRSLCGLILSLMICFGVIGNLISFVTWQKGRKCKALPGSTYLSALAISDNLILLTSGIKYVIELLFNVNLWDLSEVSCKLLHTTWHLFFLLSTWIVVSLTIERTLAVCRPLKTAIRTSKKRELIIVLFFIVVFVLINLPFTVGARLMVSGITYPVPDDGTDYTNKAGGLFLNVSNTEAPSDGNQNFTKIVPVETCQADPSSFYFKYEDQYHNWFIDFGLLFSVPVLILAVCNVLILLTLCRRKSELGGAESKQYGKTSRSISGSLTARVIALSAVQCVSVGPFSVLAVIPGIFPDRKAVDSIQFINRLFVILALVWYLNNCVNFVLYSLFGKAFRQDCTEILFGPHQRRTADVNSTTPDSVKESKPSDLTLSEFGRYEKF